MSPSLSSFSSSLFSSIPNPIISSQRSMTSTSLLNFRCLRVFIRSMIRFASGCWRISFAFTSVRSELESAPRSSSSATTWVDDVLSSRPLTRRNFLISASRFSSCSRRSCSSFSSAMRASSSSLSFATRDNASINMPETRFNNTSVPMNDQTMKNSAAGPPFEPLIAITVSLYQCDPVKISKTERKL